MSGSSDADRASEAKKADFVLVQTEQQLIAAAADLEGPDPEAPHPLYIDTEFESSRRGTRLCLIQVSAGKTIYLIDPIALADLSHLGEVLSAPGVSWVLHAGMQDVKLLTDELDIAVPERLFDTQIAWALLGPESSVSLSYVQYKVSSVRSGKGHQADDWVRRPLPASQLRYAADDVRYLPEIHRQLLGEAEKLERVDIIEQASKDALRPEREPPPPLRPADFRNAWQLDAKGQSALQFLVDWVNGLPAADRAQAPENKTLLALAARQPPNKDALCRIKGASGSVVRRHGDELVLGIRDAVAAATSEGFVPMEPPAYATFEEIRVEAWMQMMRAEVCEALRVAPDLAIPSRLLKSMTAAYLARGPDGLDQCLVGFRRELLLSSLQKYCRDRPPRT